ncbi:hypothetical protein B0T17DRAFT_510108 [Bombardia bombarda]|uniref:Uncharacterized protein n=1 Tax=Bombardia bombarda TaxID=252184 RepID=A0AA39WNF9_9PEZI|nr:hypothetical protein B0T17DRAFT_510108 [Bombardia bombarda]
MKGPTLTMAPAIETSPGTSFHRSYSTPDLLPTVTVSSPAAAATATAPAAPNKPPPAVPSVPSAVSSNHSPSRTNSLKTLPTLPAFDVPSFDLDNDFDISFAFDNKRDETLRHSLTEQRLVVGSKTEATPTVTTTTLVAPPENIPNLSRTKSMIDRPRSWLPSSKSSPDVRTVFNKQSKRFTKHNAGAALDDYDPPEPRPPLDRPKTVESFAGFAKRSWISASKSSSPPTKLDDFLDPDQADGKRRKAPKVKGKAGLETKDASVANVAPDVTRSRSAESLSSTNRAFNRASVYLTRMKQKPNVFSRSASSLSLSTTSKSSTLSDSTSADSATPPDKTTNTTPFAKGNTTTNSAASSSNPRNSSHTASSLDTVTTTSESSSQSTADTGLTMPHPTSRDPLWSTFRMLDVDFAKFGAKSSTSARMAVVRSTLIPFLRSTSHHPSNANRSLLTPEDLDRRATILNKWWNGLLEMLDAGQTRFGVNAFALAMNNSTTASHLPVITANLQPVAGVDRPALLEATTMIMMRPEWRACTSHFQPLTQRSPEERVKAKTGTRKTKDESDGDSSAANFLAQSAEHNVRTMFIANLFTQMAVVVDKMSVRHAPLSLVNWCGKACAYAFFFAPGIADVLVRLWILNGDLLRRVADEFGLPRRNKGESEDLVALFPPHLSKLGWSSVKTLGDNLRQAAKLPLMPAKIPWHGPWVSRWRGGDTDLLYIFCKYYHVLAEEFMPEGLPLLEKARAPAYVLVHAQLLSTLDSTIHRQASLDAMLGPPLSDSLHGVDAALTALSLPSNLLKGMDENRLIILLRDMLAEYSAGLLPGGKHAFAQAFMAVVKAVTKRTSRYEHAACYMLCDFLEEALTTYDAFQNQVNSTIATSPIEEMTPAEFEMHGVSQPVDYIDWPFWFDVGKMIMESNNTMSEIRVMSFIFSMWDAIIADPARKEALCVDWLLTEETFEKYFNNWCPMVRAYYMRLLCWRVCRDSGSANELDVKIFLLVSQRLKTVWSHYLWLKQTAETEDRVPPSTAPCFPTPGKRFLIIRTEVQPPQPTLLLGFDSFSNYYHGSDTPTEFRGAYSSSSESPAAAGKIEGGATMYRKKWTLLGKVLSFSASQQATLGPTSGNSGLKRTWDEELEQARRDTAAARSGQFTLGQPAGPPPPPKQAPPAAVAPSSDSGSSTGSAPVFDAATFVFRFTLTWQGQNASGAHRVLARPRLPAPAQARVSTRSAAMSGGHAKGGFIIRSESPPPIAPGLPLETRRVSGLLQTGLVSEARNARPLAAGSTRATQVKDSVNDKPLSLNTDMATMRPPTETPNEEDSLNIRSPVQSLLSENSELDRLRSSDSEHENARSYVGPARPVGIYATGAVYAGRALAEWSLVVSECNSFVDRRRDEGVMGLAEVEVPTLSVEGLGLRQRA